MAKKESKPKRQVPGGRFVANAGSTSSKDCRKQLKLRITQLQFEALKETYDETTKEIKVVIKDREEHIRLRSCEILAWRAVEYEEEVVNGALSTLITQVKSRHISAARRAAAKAVNATQANMAQPGSVPLQPTASTSVTSPPTLLDSLRRQLSSESISSLSDLSESDQENSRSEVNIEAVDICSFESRQDAFVPVLVGAGADEPNEYAPPPAAQSRFRPSSTSDSINGSSYDPQLEKQTSDDSEHVGESSQLDVAGFALDGISSSSSPCESRLSVSPAQPPSVSKGKHFCGSQEQDMEQGFSQLFAPSASVPRVGVHPS